jgi:hypothetical protein
MRRLRLPLLAIGAALVLGEAPGVAAEAPHSYLLTYRDFGPVQATSSFTPASGYELRFEGCFAKHSEEAICGFTVRSAGALDLTNVQNMSHGSAANGAAIRTCCLFVQGDNRGFPITPTPEAPAGVAVLSRTLHPGETLGVMLRVPNYKAVGPLASITFSRGQGDVGLRFPAHIVELP